MLRRLPALARAGSVEGLLALRNVHGRFARACSSRLATSTAARHPRRRRGTRRAARSCALCQYFAFCRLDLVSPPSWRRICTPRPKPSVTTGGRAGFQPRHKPTAQSALLPTLSAGEGWGASAAPCIIVIRAGGETRPSRAQLRPIANPWRKGSARLSHVLLAVPEARLRLARHAAKQSAGLRNENGKARRDR